MVQNEPRAKHKTTIKIRKRKKKSTFGHFCGVFAYFLSFLGHFHIEKVLFWHIYRIIRARILRDDAKGSQSELYDGYKIKRKSFWGLFW